ncbi:hypothetical protein BD410DRAFT_546189 [Rickenella mellea]|uniref:Uncharacterized protein n=1 Tax=Rickenella mellea TaxID=50990 RepID=A0A4Y7PQ68_9AGAM|nr:hypothetical protein BD410DRAFT_546189 [Rickenella mellea]
MNNFGAKCFAQFRSPNPVGPRRLSSHLRDPEVACKARATEKSFPPNLQYPARLTTLPRSSALFFASLTTVFGTCRPQVGERPFFVDADSRLDDTGRGQMISKDCPSNLRRFPGRVLAQKALARDSRMGFIKEASSLQASFLHAITPRPPLSPLPFTR